MHPDTVIIGMIKAAQENDETAMNVMMDVASESGINPVDVLGSALGFILALLFFLEQEGYPTDKFMQDLALSILTEES